MIDTHAHLNFSDFDKDLGPVIKKSFDEGLENIIIVSSSVATSREAVEIASKDDRLFASVGIHPQDLEDAVQFSEIENLAEEEKVVAIGETGLDYYKMDDSFAEHKNRQTGLLRRHIALAKKVNKPLIFHNRDADDDFYNTVKGETTRGVLHCYTGDWIFAKKILDIGLYISFTGIITFVRDADLMEVVKKIPMDRLMVETDCPFLAPVPYRGKRCEPWMVRETIKKIAEVRGMSFEEVDEQTSHVAKAFFGI